MADEKFDSQELLKEVFDAGRDEDPEVRLQRAGTQLANRFFMLYKTGRVHSLENHATDNAIEALRKVLAELSELSETQSLVAAGDGLYLNKILLKTDFSGFENFRYLSELFQEQKISGVSFMGVPPPEDVRTFLKALLASKGDDTKGDWVGNLQGSSIRILTNADHEETEREHVSREKLSEPRYLLRLYCKTALMLEAFVRGLKNREILGTSQLQRSIHEFIDALSSARATIHALATLPFKEGDSAYASLNITLLAILLGEKAGLSKRELSDLGMAGLLHDIGKMEIPEELRFKRGRLTAQEWEELRRSNRYSLLKLIQLKGFHPSALRRMLVAYEHAAGLPSDPKGQKPTLLSRIVAIAHCYSAMTSRKPYRDPLLPNEALKLMRRDVGKKFDPVLFQAFLQLMTTYPVGSFVRLSSHEVGVVLDSPDARPDPNRPKIRLLYRSDGKKRPPTDLELSRDPEGRTVVKMLDPGKYHVNTLAHLYAR